MLIVKTEYLNLVIALIYKPPNARPQNFIEHISNIDSCFDYFDKLVPKVIFLEVSTYHTHGGKG